MGLKVWWSSLDTVDRGLRSRVDPAELARVDAYDRPADAARSLLGAALLRVAVAEHLGVAPADVRVDRRCSDCGEDHGAPRIIAPDPALWVSVSHSGLLVVVALDTEGPVGIDVQRVADLADPADAAAWVRAEALVKAGCPPDGAGCAYRELSTPLPGYAAALATRRHTVEEPDVRRWPTP